MLAGPLRSGASGGAPKLELGAASVKVKTLLVEDPVKRAASASIEIAIATWNFPQNPSQGNQ